MARMNIMDAYRTWAEYPNHPADIQAELARIAHDEAAIRDRFYKDLEFGTGGLRGVLGAGTNRMNVHMVRKATLGLARYVLSLGQDAAQQGVVIGYDCRRMSPEFALEAGLVLAAAGVRAAVFEHLCPTPELSFAVRELNAAAGVMITASHNPPEYNGYKVYGSDGGQILPDVADSITAEIQAVADLFGVAAADRQTAEAAGLLSWVGAEMDDLYCQRVVQEICVPEIREEARRQLKIVYTPLHGTGLVPVRTALSDAGYDSLAIVPSQERPDGEFPTVKSPNPEEAAAFEVALRLANEVGADIVLGTDPDADRVGVAVRDDTGTYHLLTGNQTGGLLLDFLLTMKSQAGTLPKDGIVFKTIVTSELGAVLAERKGIAVENTLTGFKYIGDRISFYEKAGDKTFLFGYEESYGYLIAPFVRDKDAVQSCLLIAEMASWHKQRGKTLLDALNELYKQVGYYREELISATMPGEDGMEKIKAIMAGLRQNGLTVSGLSLTAVEDYDSLTRYRISDSGNGFDVSEAITLPQAEVLKYLFAGGSWLAVRPSGTEPKIKVYIGAVAVEESECKAVAEAMRAAVERILGH